MRELKEEEEEKEERRRRRRRRRGGGEEEEERKTDKYVLIMFCIFRTSYWGFDSEIMRAILNKLNKKYNKNIKHKTLFIANNHRGIFNTISDSLYNGLIDIYFGKFETSENRCEAVSCTCSYFTTDALTVLRTNYNQSGKSKNGIYEETKREGEGDGEAAKVHLNMRRESNLSVRENDMINSRNSNNNNNDNNNNNNDNSLNRSGIVIGVMASNKYIHFIAKSYNNVRIKLYIIFPYNSIIYKYIFRQR